MPGLVAFLPQVPIFQPGCRRFAGRHRRHGPLRGCCRLRVWNRSGIGWLGGRRGFCCVWGRFPAMEFLQFRLEILVFPLHDRILNLQLPAGLVVKVKQIKQLNGDDHEGIKQPRSVRGRMGRFRVLRPLRRGRVGRGFHGRWRRNSGGRFRGRDGSGRCGLGRRVRLRFGQDLDRRLGFRFPGADRCENVLKPIGRRIRGLLHLPPRRQERETLCGLRPGGGDGGFLRSFRWRNWCDLNRIAGHQTQFPADFLFGQPGPQQKPPFLGVFWPLGLVGPAVFDEQIDRAPGLGVPALRMGEPDGAGAFIDGKHARFIAVTNGKPAVVCRRRIVSFGNRKQIAGLRVWLDFRLQCNLRATAGQGENRCQKQNQNAQTRRGPGNACRGRF